jgi:protease IV
MKKEEKPQRKWGVVIILLLIIGLFSIISAGVIGIFIGILGGSGTSSSNNPYANVAIIPINGVIMASSSNAIFSTDIASATNIISLLKKASEDSSVKAIVLEINSPGGSPVPSDEITQELKKIEKPVIAYIREVGASGAYFIASGADRIYANRMSLTGSIGVIGSYLEFAKLLEDYNVTYRRLVAGDYKDMGSPFKELTSEEDKRLQTLLDSIHDDFIQEVADNRNLDYDYVKSLATGEVFTGKQAVKNKLVDELGGLDEVKTYLEKELNTTVEFSKYGRPSTFFDLFFQANNQNSFNIGRGIASYMYDKKNSVDIVTIMS